MKKVILAGLTTITISAIGMRTYNSEVNALREVEKSIHRSDEDFSEEEKELYKEFRLQMKELKNNDGSREELLDLKHAFAEEYPNLFDRQDKIRDNLSETEQGIMEQFRKEMEALQKKYNVSKHDDLTAEVDREFKDLFNRYVEEYPELFSGERAHKMNKCHNK